MFEIFGIVLTLLSTWLVFVEGSPCSQIPNCAKCIDKLACTSCNTGYMLTKNVCMMAQKPKLIITNLPHSRPITVTQLQSFNTNLRQQQGTQSFLWFGSPGYIDKGNKCIYQWNGVCIICANNYELVSGGRCVPRLVKCIKFGDNNACLQCNDKLTLQNSQCVDLGCQTGKYFSCSKCVKGYKLNENQICQLQHCNSFKNGKCTKCDEGYFIQKQLCTKNIATLQNKTDSFCVDLQCEYCKQGYISINRSCVRIENCLKLQKNICLKCLEGFSVSNIGSCVKSVDSCIKYTLNGCAECPINYILANNVCNLNTSFVDKNCQQRNFRGVCTSCKSSYRLQKKYNNLCMAPNANCKNSSKTGQCLACYQGYKLNEYSGECIIVPAIQNCAVQIQGYCKKCAQRFYLVTNTVCKEVNALCNQYQHDTGACTSCFDGYALVGNNCTVVANLAIQQKNRSKQKETIPTKNETTIINLSNCQQRDPQNSSKCLKCYSSFVVNSADGSCIGVNPLCKTYNQQNGACLTCYEGYKVDGINCIMENTNVSRSEQIATISGCKKMNYDKKQCIECIDRFVKQGKICKQVSPQCKTYNEKGACLTCYSGYTVKEGDCIIVSNNVIKNCQTYNEKTLKCEKCMEGFLLKDNTCSQKN